MEFGTMLAYFTGAIVCNSLSFRGAADAINLLYVCIFMAIALSSSKRPNNLQYKSVLPLKTRAWFIEIDFNTFNFKNWRSLKSL